MAQQPSCLSDLGTAWASVVADRRELLGAPHDGFAGSRLECKNSIEAGSGEDEFIQSHMIDWLH